MKKIHEVDLADTALTEREIRAFNAAYKSNKPTFPFDKGYNPNKNPYFHKIRSKVAIDASGPRHIVDEISSAIGKVATIIFNGVRLVVLILDINPEKTHVLLAGIREPAPVSKISAIYYN